MRLVDLDPVWMRIEEPGRLHRYVDGVAEAQGVMFLCPACFASNNGKVGTHMVLCWFQERGVPDTEKPGPGRWAISGANFLDLTLSPSIQLIGGCNWHGFVEGGQIRTA